MWPSTIVCEDVKESYQRLKLIELLSARAICDEALPFSGDDRWTSMTVGRSEQMKVTKMWKKMICVESEFVGADMLDARAGDTKARS